MKRSKFLNLQKMLMLTFLCFSAILISLITLFTHQFLNHEFLSYIDLQFQDDVTHIQEELNQSLTSHSPIQTKKLLLNYAQQGYILQITKNDKVIYDGFKENTSLIRQWSNNYGQKDNFATFIGSLHQSLDLSIHIYRPLFIEESALQHLYSMNQVPIYIGWIAFFLSILLSYVLATHLSHPLQRLTHHFQQAQSGKYTPLDVVFLIKEYEQLRQTFNDLNYSLAKQKQRRKNHSMQLSHELRTPITAIRLTLENIQEGFQEADTATLNNISEEILRLQALIEELHHLEHIESYNYDLKIETFQLDELIRQILTLLQSFIQEKHLTLTQDLAPALIQADKSRIKQVVLNLLSNAIKYNHDYGSIHISLKETEDKITLSIKDSGIGISKEKHQKIFERYYRINNDNNGLGLGLTIAKEIINAHHGDLLLFSQLNQGCEVIVILKKQLFL